MAKKNNSVNDLSARLAELDEEYGMKPVQQEEPQSAEKPKTVEEPTKKADEKQKKKPVENNGISHSFETDEENTVTPASSEKPVKEKKGLFGKKKTVEEGEEKPTPPVKPSKEKKGLFGKKKKDLQEEVQPPVATSEPEFEVPEELIYNGPNKKRLFGKKSEEPVENKSQQILIPVPIPTHGDEDQEEIIQPPYVEEEEEIVQPPYVEEDEEIVQPPYVEEEEEEIIQPPYVEEDEEIIRPPYVEEEDDTIRPEGAESSSSNSNEEDIEDAEVEKKDFLTRLKSKKQNKEVKEKPAADPNKKKSPLLNIFLIALIAIIGLVLAITLISKLLGGNDSSDSNEISISSSEFETAEQISVQKAKELIEESNSVDEIITSNEGGEISFDSGEGFATSEKTSNNPSGLISFREEEDVIVNSNGLVSYSNARFGTSFQHPPEWTELTGFTAKKTSENVSNIVMVGYPAESEKIENMRISMEGTPVSVSAKEYFSKTEGLMEQTFNKFSLIKKGETTVNGGEAPYRIYQWIPTSEEETHTYDKHKMKIKQYQVYLAGKEKVYVVTFTAEASVFDKNFDKYNKVLTTLTLQR